MVIAGGTPWQAAGVGVTAEGVQGCRDKIKTIMHKSKRKVLAALRITNSG